MKRTSIILLGMFSLSALSYYASGQILNGDYTIGNSIDADYLTLSAAIADIRTGTIAGDITFSIESGTYNETMDLSSLGNGNFKVTFSGEDKETVIVHPDGNIAADKSGISIANTHHVVLENFTLEMDDISDTKVQYDGNGTKGISVLNSSDITLDSLILSNANFVASESTKEYIASAISLAGSEDILILATEVSGAGVLIFIEDYEDVTIGDCDFRNGQFHIRSEQQAETSADGLTIRDSKFTGPFPSGRSASAIYIVGHSPNFLSASFASNLLIENNLIDGLEADPNEISYGIYISAIVEPVIRKNNVYNGYDGIFNGGCTAALIESNEIVGTSNIGLRMQNYPSGSFINNIVVSENVAMTAMFSSNGRFVHNTFHAGGSDVGVQFTGHSGDSLVVVNNIFSVASSVQNEVIYDFIKAADIKIDHNLYSGKGTENTVKMVQWGGAMGPSADFEALSDWQAYELSMDQTSQSFMPMFVGNDDYHITNETVYRFGGFLVDVASDIDGDIRDQSVGVDVGADQFCLTYNQIVDIAACTSYEFDGTELTVSGEYQANLLSQSMCDSLVTLNLTILQASEGADTVQACGSYEWAGLTLLNSGTYDTLLTNAVGCDSTATLVLTILDNLLSYADTVVTCSPYEWHGLSLPTSGDYDTLLTSSQGCDSLVSLNLTLLESDFEEVVLDVCSSFEFGSQLISESGLYEEIFTNEHGCDSTVMATVVVFNEPGNEIFQDGLDLVAADSTADLVYQWFHCDTEEIVEAEMGHRFTAPADEAYKVRISNGVCTVSSDCMSALREEAVLGTDISSQRPRIFPNPTRGKVHLSLPYASNYIISLQGLDGKLIKQYDLVNDNALDIEVFENGLYLLRVESVDSKEVQVFRVLKR